MKSLNKIKIVLALVMLMFGAVAHSQTNPASSNIRWEITQVTNITTGQVETVDDDLVTTGSQTITWSDADGNVKFAFDVTSVTGSWPNVNQSGSIQYNFTQENQPAQLTITRSGANITLSLKLYMQETTPQEYEMTATTFTVL